MKNLIVGLLLLATISSTAQNHKASAISDPKLGQIVVTSMQGNPVDPAELAVGQVIKFKIPVSNLHASHKIPAGSAVIKIGLGSKLQLDPLYNMDDAGLGNYIRWTSTVVGGQTVVIGELTGDVPFNLDNISAAFKVKAVSAGKSTITANFLITNHNTITVLSDENPNNNVSFLPYTIVAKTATVPVIKINEVIRGGCSVNLIFSIDKEISIVRYDVEVSNDGVNYIKVGEIAASNIPSYRSSFNLTANIEAQVINVRVRSVDTDGNYRYSTPVSVSGVCEKMQPWSLSVYPNPATDVKSVVISTKGEFKGKYRLTMFDVTGQMIQSKEFNLERVSAFTYNFGVIASGKYLLQLVNVDGSQSGTLKFEKL